MNSRDERSRSCWMDAIDIAHDGALTSDIACDVVIIGSGIAGLSAAYELVQRGKSVAVIDRGTIGGGMTARTTAHLASALDDYYSELVKVHGEDAASPLPEPDRSDRSDRGHLRGRWKQNSRTSGRLETGRFHEQIRRRGHLTQES